MDIIESINNYSDFDNKKIIDFIKLGNDLIDVQNETEPELYLNSFLSYSRNYMNFLMNHTDYLYILYVYKCLLKQINTKQEYIRYVIKINNYILSIIQNIDFTDKIKTINDFPEYYNYFMAIKDLFTQNMNYIQLQSKIGLHELVINLTIIENKEHIETYSKNEFYDNLRFYFYNINEIQIYTKNELLQKAIKQIQYIEQKQTEEYIKLLQIFTKSIYNLLLTEYFEEIKEIHSILEPLIEMKYTSYTSVDNFIQSVIQTDNIQTKNIQTNNIQTKNIQPDNIQTDTILSCVLASSVVGFILFDMRFNII